MLVFSFSCHVVLLSSYDYDPALLLDSIARNGSDRTLSTRLCKLQRSVSSSLDLGMGEILNKCGRL